MVSLQNTKTIEVTGASSVWSAYRILKQEKWQAPPRHGQAVSWNSSKVRWRPPSSSSTTLLLWFCLAGCLYSHVLRIWKRVPFSQTAYNILITRLPVTTSFVFFGGLYNELLRFSMRSFSFISFCPCPFGICCLSSLFIIIKLSLSFTMLSGMLSGLYLSVLLYPLLYPAEYSIYREHCGYILYCVCVCIHL